MLLTIECLQVSFAVGSTVLPAVHEVSLALAKKSKTAVIGETGCGKSVLAAAVAGLLPDNAHVRGSMSWENAPLSTQALQIIRGRELSLIPQNPLGSLNPVLSAGFQVGESLARSQPVLNKHARDQRILALFEAVGFTQPQSIYQAYPHQLSGGMAQRVLLAAAMASTPKLVIADEPTKGLDLATRNENVLLLHQVFADSALLLITHDMEVAATCHELIVMYAGEIVETGRPETLLTKPLHPYTCQLLASHPSQGLVPIPGMPPVMSALAPGCRFVNRCAVYHKLNTAQQQHCRTEHPALKQGGAAAAARCWHA